MIKPLNHYNYCRVFGKFIQKFRQSIFHFFSENTDEDPSVVTLARPSEYRVKNSASTVSDGKNSSSSATDRDRMKKKFQVVFWEFNNFLDIILAYENERVIRYDGKRWLSSDEK